MTSTKKRSSSSVTRRVMLGATGALALAAFGGPAMAFSADQARDLIGRAVRDIHRIINSGKPEATMLREFEAIFEDYGDSDVIGQLVLGPDGRTASSQQKAAFAKAFKIYISHKYGRRFREFIGGRIEVVDARAVKTFYEVTTVVQLAGQAPFEVEFVVADRSGLFIDMKIEGISLVKAERAEVGAMLDKRRGDLDRLIADLATM